MKRMQDEASEDESDGDDDHRRFVGGAMQKED